MLDLIHHSRGLAQIRKKTVHPLSERVMLYFSRERPSEEAEPRSPWKIWLVRGWRVVLLAAMSYGVVRVVMILTGLQKAELQEAAVGLGATFLRVNLTLLIGALWTIPAGVAIGFNPRLARIAQPLAQIAASVPATALFPVVLLLLIRVGGGLGMGSIVLLLLGTQWYILFNVIAGAIAIPTDLKECCSVFQHEGNRALEEIDSAGNFSLPHHRHGHGVGWGVECEHHRGIFSLQGPHLHDGRSGSDHFSSYRCRQLRLAAGGDHDDGGDRGDD